MTEEYDPNLIRSLLESAPLPAQRLTMPVADISEADLEKIRNALLAFDREEAEESDALADAVNRGADQGLADWGAGKRQPVWIRNEAHQAVKAQCVETERAALKLAYKIEHLKDQRKWLGVLAGVLMMVALVALLIFGRHA